jgi:serine phosphatase RsbU (regulator of sigma subunit)
MMNFSKTALALAGLTMIIGFHLLGLIPFQEQLRHNSFDWYQSLYPRERVSAPVVIVDIDESSLEEYGQWPWPRSLMAQLITKISEAEPAAIALDIIMPEPDRTSACELTHFIPNIELPLIKEMCSLPSNDELLADALSTSQSILGIAGLREGQHRPIASTPIRQIGDDPRPHLRHFGSAIQNIEILERAVSGHAVLSADLENGIVRRVPMVANVSGTVLPSLSLESLRLATGLPAFSITSDKQGIQHVGIADLVIPTQKDGSLWVHYSPHDASRFISAKDILSGTNLTQELNRKLILVGFTGLGLVDFPSTALGERVPGVEIHAQVLESIFDGTTLIRPAWAIWFEALLMLLAGIFILFIAPRMKAWVVAPIFMGIVSTAAIIGVGSFVQWQLLLDVASPIVFFLIFYFATLADSLIRDESQIETLEVDLRIQREEAAKVQGEMEAAKRFQMGIVPDATTVFANERRIDISAQMQPAKMVGGDLYDCFMLDENQMFFAVGDVCGKGVPASLFMVISKTICKSLVLRDNAAKYSLGELITMANKDIARDNPEMQFITLFIGVLNLTTGDLEYVNAGHERPLVVSQIHDPMALTELSGPPIGTVDDFNYASFHTQLSYDSVLCLFTDGVTDAVNKNEEMFGHDRLVKTLNQSTHHKTTSEMIDKVKQTVYSFVGDAEPFDDLTLMLIKRQ